VEENSPEVKEWGSMRYNRIVTETTPMTGKVLVNGVPVKKFRGETAWMDAERYAYDLQIEGETQ